MLCEGGRRYTGRKGSILEGPSPGVTFEQKAEKRERAKGHARGKGLPGRGRGGCKALG